MWQWFGPPFVQSFDSDGKLKADWQYHEAFATVGYVRVKSQLLSAVFDTNNVVERFSIADDVSTPAETNAPAVRATKAGKGF
jgi:hypothetical protein